MKKFRGKSNAYGKFIKEYRLENKFSRADLSRELDLIGISISPDEIYRIETQQMALKDFELISICVVLNINLKELEKIIKDSK